MLCSQCKEKAHKTNWLPESGIDPTLREYECEGRIKHTWYSNTGRLSKVKGVKRKYEQAKI